MRLTLLALLLPTFVFGQLRFKPSFDVGVGFKNENLLTLNSGLIIEKKLDIDKSIETGIFSHSFEFLTPRTDEFYQAFVKGRNLDNAWDTTTHLKVSFHFTTIPIGANYYITPKFFVGYRLGFNFFKKSKFTGIDARNAIDPADGLESFSRDFDKTIFKKFYINHNISFNYIFWRRVQFGMGFLFTPRGQFFKRTPNRLYESFNKQASKYFAMNFSLQFYLFQIKSHSL